MDRPVRYVFAAVSLLVAVLVIVLVIMPVLFPPVDYRFEGIPNLDGYVTDDADVLTYYAEDLIWNICYYIDDNSSCEIAVLMVNDTGERSVNEFALRVFQKNGIGKEGKDNGVLILFVTGTSEWKVEVGYGLQGILTSPTINDLFDLDIQEFLAEGDYDSAAYWFTLSIASVIDTDYIEQEQGDPAFPIEGIPLTWWQWLIVISLGVGLVIVTRGRILYILFFLISRGGGRGGFGGGRSGGGGNGGRF